MANSKYQYVRLFETPTPLLPQTHLIVRLDGRSFHKLTSHYDFCKPNDPLALDVMNKAALKLMNSFPDIIMAYGDSDEYSFLLRRDTQLYNRRGDKIVSVLTSSFTAYYNYYWNQVSNQHGGPNNVDLESVVGEVINGESIPFKLTNANNYRTQLPPLDIDILPTFDGRIVTYPNKEVVIDYFRWRQVDCHINNLYNTTFWTLVIKGGLSPQDAERKLMGTFSKDKNEILFKEFGINYNNEPEMFKKGTIMIREINKINFKSTSNTDNNGNDLSDRQQQRLAKSLRKSPINIHHCDLINSQFWDQRPHLFN